MAKFTMYNSSVSRPTWAGQALDEDSLVPGGAKVDPSEFTAGSTGYKFIPSGTLLGRTLAERDADTGFGIALTTDDEIFLLAQDIRDAANNAECSLYRHYCMVYENALPGFSGLGALQGTIRALYLSVKGA